MNGSIDGSWARLSGCKTGAGVLLAALLSTSSCSSTLTPEVDARSGACGQTYGFGNYGCAEVTGQVIGSQGQPLSGVSVGPRYLADVDAGGYNTPYVDTDAQGHFRFRITRFASRRSAVVPDTFSLFVSAAVRPPAAPGAVSTAVDSVLVRVELAPIGEAPRAANVEIRLPYP